MKTSSMHLRTSVEVLVPDQITAEVWELYPIMIFLNYKRWKMLEQMTDSPGYDAEATVAFDGSKVLYTSITSGDRSLVNEY